MICDGLTMQCGQRSYIFKFKLAFSLLCLFLFVLCCTLGVWQIKRYHFKVALLAHFQPTKVIGHYVQSETMLVQNRYHDGQIGFEVLTPFQIKGEKKLLLVNRGWVAKLDKQTLSAREQQITGYIKLLDEYQFILGKNILNPTALPIVMQKIDLDELTRMTHRDYYPYILRLDAKEPNGFVREWIVSAMPPERHMAYAVQWFALALVLLIAYFCFCCERVHNAEKKK